jgi:hypothetical protein
MPCLGGLTQTDSTRIHHRKAGRMKLKMYATPMRKSRKTGAIELTRCFLRLTNLPNCALDRLSRYEATIWRQARQIIFALEFLDRRKPWDRRRRLRLGHQQELRVYDPDEC